MKNASLVRMSLAASVAAVVLVSGSAKATRKAESVPGELIVGLAPGVASVETTQRALRSALEQVLGAGSVRAVKSLQMDSGIQKITLSNPVQRDAAISQLRNSLRGAVRYAEPNWIYTADMLVGEPNDADFAANQWDMKNTGQVDKPDSGQTGKEGSDINVAPLWAEGVTGNPDLLVAIVDTGIDYTHPQLAANVFKNRGEIPGNGKDDDGNGIVDDVYGANFESGDGVGNGRDDNNHGSHCAGTIGAVGNDGLSIAGVNWQTTMLPSKFLSASGSGSLEGAVNAIKYATKMGAKILSNSWGGGGYSEALKEAIEEAGAAGALFVAAAGNDGVDNDSDPHYPSNYELPNVISVAATDNRDAIASFSNYGRRTVHVSAPGKNIYSTVKDGQYAIYSGTSMATPHVSGIAALIWGANPSWTYADVKKRLIETSTPVRGLRRKSASNGRVNAYNAFHGIITPSDEPAESAWKDMAYTLESAHPYGNDANATFEVSAPGAKFIRVVFDRVETEARYDNLTVESAAGEVVDTVSGTRSGEYVSEYVAGDKAIVRLRSDSSVDGFGFHVSRIQIVD
jgi:subtilisin family serine protease